MVRGVCFNGTMVDTHNYTSPVPLVGVYIAAANLVCFFLILSDVWAGFRHKNYWFPCKFFSINSVTLTLIATAAKIPVDLTTTMPSKQDQLSKLFGTVFICVTMGFMLPSIAKNAEFESYANVTALSIFVITVVVNICIQMATGVIFSFIPEHAIILIFMLFLLVRFWISVTIINVIKSDYFDISKDLIRNGEQNMVARLKHCFLYGYHSCPQLYSCRCPHLGDVGTVCMMCSIVLVQATLRSFIWKNLSFCQGVSDYGWSMWLMVISQSLTIAFITFAIGGRWLINLAHCMNNYIKLIDPGDDETYLQFQYLFSLRNVPSFVEKSFRFVIYLPLLFANIAFTLSDRLVHLFPAFVCHWLCGVRGGQDTRDENCKEFMNLLSPHDVYVCDWAFQRGLADMNRCLQIDEKVTLKHLNNLFSNVAPSQELSYKVGPDGEGTKISLLSMMLLVEIAKLVNPRGKVSLANVLAEVFEIILFIDNTVNTGSSKDRLRSTLAKVIHQYGLTTGRAEFAFEQEWDLENHKVDFKLIRKPGCENFGTGGSVGICIREAANQVNDFISYQTYESSEVVYGRIEQLFVDMLHAFLAKLPVAVFSHVLESPVEEYLKRVRVGLGFIVKLQSVESHVRFSLPSGSNITSLFHDETLGTISRVVGIKVESEIQDAQDTWEKV